AADASLSRRKKPPALPPVYARHRLLVKATDPAKFRRYLTALLAGADAEIGSPVRGKGDPPSPGWLSTVKPTAARPGVALLALIEDAGLTASLHPFRSRVAIAWGLSGLGRSRLEGAGADDGLLDPPVAAADAVAAAGLWLGGLETLRAAPRVGPFAGKLAQAI